MQGMGGKMDIKDFSPEELQDELNRRDEKEKISNKPQLIENPDLTGLKNTIGEYIDSIFDGTYHEDSDIRHWIFEAAVTAIYGKDVFDWINKNI